MVTWPMTSRVPEMSSHDPQSALSPISQNQLEVLFQQQSAVSTVEMGTPHRSRDHLIQARS